MLDVVLSVLIISAIISFAMWIFISALIAVAELSIKEIFSSRLFSEIKANLTASGSVKIMFIVMVLCIMVFTPCAMDAKRQISAEKRGECTCRCKKCKAAADRIEAVIRYLALDDEDLYGVKEND